MEEDKTIREIYAKLITMESTLAVIQNTLKFLPCESHCKRLDAAEKTINEIKIEAEKSKTTMLLSFLSFIGFVIMLIKDFIK